MSRNNSLKVLSYYLKLTFLAITLFTSLAKSQQSEQFLNKSGCLYAYVEDLSYHVIIPEQRITLNGYFPLTNKRPFVDDSSECVGSNGEPGSLVMKFSNESDKHIQGITVKFNFEDKSKELGYWLINKAQITIDTNDQNITSKEYNLRVNDLYAGQGFSFSCASLKLSSLPNHDSPKKDAEPRVEISLGRFQMQPFSEPPQSVPFAPSFDCSVWLTIPALMGLAFILFSTGVILIGVYFLQSINTTDLKFSKQAGMLMNQAQLDATKG